MTFLNTLYFVTKQWHTSNIRCLFNIKKMILLQHKLLLQYFSDFTALIIMIFKLEPNVHHTTQHRIKLVGRIWKYVLNYNVYSSILPTPVLFTLIDHDMKNCYFLK